MTRLRHGLTTTILWETLILRTLPLWLVACLPMSRAQDISSISTTINEPLPTGTAFTSRNSAMFTTTSPPASTISPSHTFIGNSTSSATSKPTSDPPTEMFPPATDPDGNPITHGNIFNYYFLFLIIFAVLVAILLWWVRRQKQRRKEQMRQSGQNALARDLEGWPAARRFMHGRYGRYQTSANVRREEGLDERGEAPPPYQPKGDASVTETHAEPSVGVSVPLRALPRDPVERTQPPGYTSSTNEHNVNTQATSPS